MTSREAAEKILNGLSMLVEDSQNWAKLAKTYGLDEIAKSREADADTIANIAAGLKSAIDDGEFGE